MLDNLKYRLLPNIFRSIPVVPLDLMDLPPVSGFS
jgi:hypothetical protein